MDNLPLYSVDLVKELDLIYPNKLPPLDITDRHLGVLIGQRMVVDFLLNRMNEDTEELPQVLQKD